MSQREYKGDVWFIREALGNNLKHKVKGGNLHGAGKCHKETV